MGSWNATCMISNLPIFCGEEVKLIILHMPYGNGNLFGMGGYCYSNDLMRPAFLPITGKYNDYGGIEDVVKDWVYDLNTDILRKNFKKIWVKKKELTEFGISDFVYGIERGSLKTTDDADSDLGDESNFSFVMIRKDVWDGIVDAEKNSKYYWNDERKNDDYYIDAITFVDRKINKTLEEFERMNSMGVDFSSYVKFPSADDLFSKIDVGNYLLKNSIKEEVRNVLYESVIIGTFLEHTRKGWMVQPGSGSQTDDLKPYILFSDLVKNICEKIKL